PLPPARKPLPPAFPPPSSFPVLPPVQSPASLFFPTAHFLPVCCPRAAKPALTPVFPTNWGSQKSFTRFFSKNRGSGEGRALSQAPAFRTPEAFHSCKTFRHTVRSTQNMMPKITRPNS